MGDTTNRYHGARRLSLEEISDLVQLTSDMNHLVSDGSTPYLLTRPAGAEVLWLEAHVTDEWWVRPGNHTRGFTFLDGDVTPASVDTIAETGHGYETGEGPFRLSSAGAALTGDPDLTFADADPDTITRDAGSWVTDGFVAGQTITVSGSASNDGTYLVDSVTATVLTLDVGETLAAEGPSNGITVTAPGALPAGLAEATDYYTIAVDDDTLALATSVANAEADTRVDITAAASGGIHSFDPIALIVPSSPPTTSETSGYSAFPIRAGAGGINPPWRFPAPDEVTLYSLTSGDVIYYWWT